MLLLLILITHIYSYPVFDPSGSLQNILIPADAPPNSIIYRIRAYDPSISYPLIFGLQADPITVSIETLNCTRLNSICHANVVLKKKLEIERFYDFVVTVENQRGDVSKLNCSFKATNATTPISEIFPGAPTLLMVSEDARRNTELGSLIARGNKGKKDAVVMELWGGSQFGLHQKLINTRDAKATVVLLGALDYEKATVHHLTILANDPFTNLEEDTRNIASWPLLIAVTDVQDTPPIFTLAPPTTTLSPTLLPGDLVLKIHAEDGDRGKPRSIRYGLVPEGNPFTTFFNISENSGELRLAKPLNEILAISHSGQPIILTVIAEEVRTGLKEPPVQSSTVQLALIPPGIKSGTPIFSASKYSTLLNENAPIGTILELAQTEIVSEPGSIIALSLTNNNGTFDIVPNVVEGQSKFQIKVYNPELLDYEKRQSVECYIVAKEIGNGNFTSSAKLEVILNDVNDNKPFFTQNEYQVSIQENTPIGTTILRVEANDGDKKPTPIRYTKLLGNGSQMFDLNPITGVLTVLDSLNLDAEKDPVLNLVVEAVDEDGNGQSSTSSIIIKLLDINDQPPQFEKKIYEFIVNEDRTAFTAKAFIRAVDLDLSFPNNDVRYELIKPVDNLFLNEKTGELIITKNWIEDKIVTTVARAYDGGVPRLSSECRLKIYPHDGGSRKMTFLVPGRNPNIETIRKQLSVLTGAKITIHEIRPYLGEELGAKDISTGHTNQDKSVVVATLTYSDDIIDVNTVRQVFDENDIQKASVKKSEGNLLWLLILLLILALILALTLILCCICQGCPLYVPPKRRKTVEQTSQIEKVIQGSGLGTESKSVQVAEWFGRREAWTPDQEAESLQRHEQERGSDIRIEGRKVRQLVREPSREQLYIREGNTDILRLVTRGNEQTYFVTDSGKDILMKRFIDQQESTLPNAVTKLQAEHEMLEASFREQNALLRQVLLERERDLRLETQSLPAGTQTDQDVETQTEPMFLRPSQRKVRSDNDASEDDEEIAIIRAKGKRRTRFKKLKTPIQEESEIEQSQSEKVDVRQTRTSVLREKKASARNIEKEVLREISASLEYSESEEELKTKYFSDSLEEISPRSEKTDSSNKQDFHSASDFRVISEKTQQKSQSHSDLTSAIKQTKRKPPQKSSRYMEWYNKNNAKSEEGQNVKKPKLDRSKGNVKKSTSRLMQETESSARKKNGTGKKNGLGPEHPLLQHSEYRYEGKYPLARKVEEDNDSGIALTRLPITQKKSVFTIAYNDMHTSQLRPDSHSPPL